MDAPYLQDSFATRPSDVKAQEKRCFRQNVAKNENRQEFAVVVLSDRYFETSSKIVSMSTAPVYCIGLVHRLCFSGVYHPKSAQNVPLTAVEYIGLPNCSHGLSSSSLSRRHPLRWFLLLFRATRFELL